MVGDLDRIIRYPALGFQIDQEIPDSVLGHSTNWSTLAMMDIWHHEC